jgi:hypothetical protein
MECTRRSSPIFGAGATDTITGATAPSFAAKPPYATAAGAQYQFGLRGVTNAWLDTDGKTIMLDLREDRKQRPLRHFSLYGTWHGPDLVLDDRKTMFMYIQPGGSLAPTTSYTSPVPEKHAKVTMSWGSKAGFDSLCAALSEHPSEPRRLTEPRP